jgi:hypothetical protein
MLSGRRLLKTAIPDDKGVTDFNALPVLQQEAELAEVGKGRQFLLSTTF